MTAKELKDELCGSALKIDVEFESKLKAYTAAALKEAKRNKYVFEGSKNQDEQYIDELFKD